MKYFCRKLMRRGFILYLVCVLAMCMLTLVIGLNRFKSGAVLQMARNIDQEMMVVTAAAGINEILAGIKIGVNSSESPVGKSIRDFWQKSARNLVHPLTIWSCSYSAHQLPVANKIAQEQLGSSGSVTGEARLIVRQIVGPGMPSFIGVVQLMARVSSAGSQGTVVIREHRDLKIVDLSDPFLDKYALFVKSFCKTINDPDVDLIVEGIDDPVKYSFVYLGNRNYPICQEFPAGSRSASAPPVLLDLDFEEDRALLGGFYQPGGFQAKNKEIADSSSGKLFWVRKPELAFKPFCSRYSLTDDFHKVPDIAGIYDGLIDSCRSSAGNQTSVAYPIMLEHQKANGKTENSKVFHSLLQDCFDVWRYHYGYTDYQHVTSSTPGSLAQVHPLSGLVDYFAHVAKTNPQRLAGGKMPAFFGESRDRCIFVEGPVFLRFFKLGFIDESTVKFGMFAGMNANIDFPAIPMRYEAQAVTFAGKPAGTIDKMTDRLMSHPVHLSINNFFFGTQNNASGSLTAVGDRNIQGYDVFPIFDPMLTTASQFYLTAGEFLQHRLKNIEGQRTLDLDGINIIAGIDGEELDLTKTPHYRGRGMVIMFRGNCRLASLEPMDAERDSLRLYLMNGRFMATSVDKKLTIRASLVATTYFKDNSQPDPAQEGSLLSDGKDVHIIGNLVVDSLFDMSNISSLKISHDPGLYFPDYPVRTSIGQVKTFYAIDYSGSDR